MRLYLARAAWFRRAWEALGVSAANSGNSLRAPCYAPQRIASKLSNSSGVRASVVAGFSGVIWLDLAFMRVARIRSIPRRQVSHAPSCEHSVASPALERRNAGR